MYQNDGEPGKTSRFIIPPKAHTCNWAIGNGTAKTYGQEERGQKCRGSQSKVEPRPLESIPEREESWWAEQVLTKPVDENKIW